VWVAVGVSQAPARPTTTAAPDTTAVGRPQDLTGVETMTNTPKFEEAKRESRPAAPTSPEVTQVPAKQHKKASTSDNTEIQDRFPGLYSAQARAE
jgi:hypothetical protein